MTFNLIAFEEFIAQANAEIRRVNPDIDPTVFGSFTVPYNVSASALAYSVQQVVVDLSVQLFPQTAEGEFLERWAGYENLERLPASSATGFISIEGIVGTIIPALTIFQGSNGLDYESQAVSTVIDIAQGIQSLERSGSIVTATLADDHQLASGVEVTITGAIEPEYNGTFISTVIARNQFTYSIATTPTTPATGTINYAATFASIELKAVDTGQQTNVSGGAVFTPVPAISNVDPSGFAQFDGMSGGAEIETDEALRTRVILSRSIIEGVFTADQVKLAALGIAGNTRVFVVRPSLSVADPAPAPGVVPAPGQVAIYVLRDDDANIIPTQTVLDNTKAAIIADGALPAHSSEIDVFVFGPLTVSTDFDFASITPDTPTMRDAVGLQLQAFFEDTVEFEQDVTEAAYLGAIQNTQDLQTGDIIQSFSLTSPSGDIAVSAGEIAVLGSVTFP